MENNKISKYKWLIPIILLAILVIITFYKTIKNREEKQYNVLYNKIEYAAKECFLNQECTGTITLDDLYEKQYLEEQYDPITKELLNKNIQIEYTNDEIIIHK